MKLPSLSGWFCHISLEEGAPSRRQLRAALEPDAGRLGRITNDAPFCKFFVKNI